MGFMIVMDSTEFKTFRKRLDRTQREIAQLLGLSIKAVSSYEQGTRNVPSHVERQMFFLISRISKNQPDQRDCWVIKNCSPEIKEQCPAWEFHEGHLCWIINGTMCCNGLCQEWEDKINCCKSCEVFAPRLELQSLSQIQN